MIVMSENKGNPAQLVFGILALLVGTKGLITGTIRHMNIPQIGASGDAARLAGLLCIIFGIVVISLWIRDRFGTN